MSFAMNVYNATVKMTKVAAVVSIMLEEHTDILAYPDSIFSSIKGPLALIALLDEVLE